MDSCKHGAAPAARHLRWVSCLVVSSTCLVTVACSSGSSGTATNKDAASEAAPGPLSCQELRVRVRANCGSEVDQACVDAQVALASPGAQTTFRALAACTLPFCATGDFYCTCEQRCFGDGNCLTETEACAAGAPDEVCEVLCH